MKSIRRLIWKSRLHSLGRSLQNFRQLLHWQWLPQEQVLAFQRRRMKQLLLHAYHHVPYYRELLRKAKVVDDSGMVNLANFGQISLLDKETIRARFEEIKSDDLHLRKWYTNSSGGSTGKPAKIIQDQDYKDLVLAVKMLNDLWSGYWLGDKRMVLWGSERDLLAGQHDFRARIGRWVRNELWLNAFRMTPEQMRTYVNQINAFKPVQILAYAESIYEVAQFMECAGLRVESPPCAIMSSAGTLHSHMRETIERVFKTPVFNRYGSREVGDVACECERHKGLHVSMFTHFVEVLRADGTQTEPGETGEFVVTLLSNYAMPLIRYRIGDLGAWSEEPCTCGRSWLTLREIKGRVTDVFLKEDGTQIHGEYFTHLFYFNDWVEKFQVVQEDYDCIRIYIVPRKSYSRSVPKMRDITEKIRLVMGHRCRVKYQFLDEIAPTSSGKHRYTISKLAKC